MSSRKLKPQIPPAQHPVAQQLPEQPNAMHAAAVIKKHSGPLPAPEELVAFGQISPDFPERIMRMAEIEQQHRIEIDKAQVSAQKQELDRLDHIAKVNGRNATLGMLVSLTVIIVVMAATVYCVHQHQQWPASVLGGGGLVAIIAAIMYGGKLKQNTGNK